MEAPVQTPPVHLLITRPAQAASGLLGELRKTPHTPFYPNTAAECARKLTDVHFELPVIADILRRQATAFGVGEASWRAIDALVNGAACVFTGQQCGLLGGPALTLHKAMAAIATAQKLADELGRAVVPCFWLAADDHDFREVATVRFPNSSGPVELQIAQESAETDFAVGATHLSPDITHLVKQLPAILPQGDGFEATLRAVEEAYLPGLTLAEAFARLLARLLADYPVIIVNPHDREIKRLALPVFQRALREAARHNAALLANARELRAAGYHPQVQVSEGRANLFYHTPQRSSVLHKDGKCWCPGADAANLDAELLERPELFSPNVLLRPVVQDTLFPTVAYVGGAAECAYFAQVSALYAEYGRPMPEIVCRPQITLLEEKTKRQLDGLGISLEDLAPQDDRLLNNLARQRIPADLLSQLAASREAALNSLDALTHSIAAFEPTLHDTVQTARGQIERQFENLEKKLSSAAKRKAEDLTQRVRSLQQQLMPDGLAQERFYSPLPWLAKYGMVMLKTIFKSLRSSP